MYLSPDALRSLLADAPLTNVDVRPRVGVSREGVHFAMGHEVFATFDGPDGPAGPDGPDVRVTIDPTRVPDRAAIRWGITAIPPVGLILRRRQSGVVHGRGLATGVRAFDRTFNLESEAPASALAIVDRPLAERLAASETCLLDGVVAIRPGQHGIPGFATDFRVPPRPAIVAESAAITRALWARLAAVA